MGKCAGNATQAARRAGYGSTENAAGVAGHELLRNPKIQDAIQARVQADPAIMTREERQRMWSQMARGEGRFRHATIAEMREASVVLGKSQGDFVDKQDIREDVHYHISWDEDEEPEPREEPRSPGAP